MISPIFSNPQGFCLESLNISQCIIDCIKKNDWNKLDEEFQKLTSPGGEIFQRLLNYIYFESIEFMISIRDSAHEWEEDGIWHDDGSRVLAFSLSLTLEPDKLQGGVLGIRKKGQEDFIKIPTPAFGTMIVFLTGVHGFEHRIHQVTSGRRIIIAGWCS